MRLWQVTLTVESLLAADPQDVRRTAVALAAAELAPDGVITVDHGAAVAYLIGGWWITVRLPEHTRDLIAAFYAGRTAVHPVTFGLLVPTVADVEAARASIQTEAVAA